MHANFATRLLPRGCGRGHAYRRAERIPVKTHRLIAPFGGWTLACTLLAASFWVAQLEAAAQELGVYRSVGRSDLREIGSAEGFGAGVRVITVRPVSLHLAYYQQQDRTDRIDAVCNSYAPAFSCKEEAIRTKTMLRGLSGTALLRTRPVRILELEAGAGLSMNTVTGHEETASGRPSNLFASSTGQTGVLVAAGVRLRPVTALPITFNAGVAQHRLVLGGCVDEARWYGPYCGATQLREVRVGIGYDGDWNRRIGRRSR